MAYVCVEVSCAPNGEEKYPVPTTLRMVRIFADAREAAQEFTQDQIIKAESEYSGQDIYYLLWKTDEPLNLDRVIVQDNTIHNCGMWLPESERIYNDVSDLEVELIPPQRIKQRAKQREMAQRNAAKERKRAGGKKKTSIVYGDTDQFDDDSEYVGSGRIGSAAGGNSVGRSASGAPWRKAW